MEKNKAIKELTDFTDTCRDFTYKFREQYLREYLNRKSETLEDSLEKILISFMSLEDSISDLFNNTIRESINTKLQTSRLYQNLLEAINQVEACKGAIFRGNIEQVINALRKINASYNHIYKMIHEDRLVPNLTDEDKEHIDFLEKEFYNLQDYKIVELNDILKNNDIKELIELEDE